MKANREDHRQYHLTILVIAAILSLLCGSSVAAQEPRPSGSTEALVLPPLADNGELSARRSNPFVSAPAPGVYVGALRLHMYGPRLTAGDGQSASPPPATGEIRSSSGTPVAMPPMREMTLTFKSQANHYWRPRPASAIPATASPGMFPGSRLRGPFEQTYPRPFSGGGQP